MARAPETGFYFEPLAERLALIVEGAPFPSDDAWAYVGDPVEMSAQVARLEVANRWPGVDPEALEVEFETSGFERLAAEIERLQREERDKAPVAGEIDFDVDLLLREAESLRELPRTVGGAIARAHEEDAGAGGGATSPPPRERT